MSDSNRQQRRAAARKLPPRHITDQLAERAETTGCDRCGARFGDLLPYFITRTASDFSVRCGNCLDDVTTVAVGTALTGGDPWSQDDKAWFAAHPTRRWRLREPWPGEQTAIIVDAGEVGRDELAAFTEEAIRRELRIAIAVLQIRPGRRVREPVGVPTADPLNSFTDAGIIALVPSLAAKVARYEAVTEDEQQQGWCAHREARFAILKKVVAP